MSKRAAPRFSSEEHFCGKTLFSLQEQKDVLSPKTRFLPNRQGRSPFPEEGTYPSQEPSSSFSPQSRQPTSATEKGLPTSPFSCGKKYYISYFVFFGESSFFPRAGAGAWSFLWWERSGDLPVDSQGQACVWGGGGSSETCLVARDGGPGWVFFLTGIFFLLLEAVFAPFLWPSLI